MDAIFQDPGASCVDDLDGPLTTNITVLGWVNTSELGTTELVYSCEERFFRHFPLGGIAIHVFQRGH